MKVVCRLINCLHPRQIGKNDKYVKLYELLLQTEEGVGGRTQDRHDGTITPPDTLRTQECM